MDLALRLALGLMFLASAATKVPPASYRRFRLATAELLGVERVGALPVLSITAEIAVGLALILGRPRADVTAYAALALLLGFTTVLYLAILRGVDTSCQCFGALSSDRSVGWQEIARNLLLIAATLLLIHQTSAHARAIAVGTASYCGLLVLFGAAALHVSHGDLQRRLHSASDEEFSHA